MKRLENSAFEVGRAGHDPATYGLKGREYLPKSSGNSGEHGHRDPTVAQAQAIPFPAGCVVEITQGMSKGLRGVVVGEARSMYLGVPDVVVRLEGGREAWLRHDFLRRVS